MNPITDLTGPEFLVFYALAILAVAIACRWFVWRSDRTLDAGSAPMDAGRRGTRPTNEAWTAPGAADPYEVAYLRGGTNELARVAVVGLAERGFLNVNPSGPHISQAPGRPDPARLTPFERDVFDFFAMERTGREAFRAEGIASRTNAHALPYEERLQRQKLLMPAEVTRVALKCGAMGVAALVVVALLRIMVALERGRPFGFLLLLGIAGLVIVIWSCAVGRVSRRGNSYLDSARSRARSFAPGPAKAGHYDTNASSRPYLLMTALFGVAALAGTPYEGFAAAFRKSKASSTGACGGGVYGGGDGGGSDDGGASDGGGGGGGGGCGGCGAGGGGCGGGG